MMFIIAVIYILQIDPEIGEMVFMGAVAQLVMDIDIIMVVVPGGVQIKDLQQAVQNQLQYMIIAGLFLMDILKAM